MTNQTKHTPEPWIVSDSGVAFYSTDGEWIGVSTSAINPRNVEKGRFNARRMVACVNACRGLSTDELEKSGLVSAVGSELMTLGQQRDQLLAALEALLNSFIRSEVKQAESLLGCKVFANEVFQNHPEAAAAQYAIAAAKGGAV